MTMTTGLANRATILTCLGLALACSSEDSGDDNPSQPDAAAPGTPDGASPTADSGTTPSDIPDPPAPATDGKSWVLTFHEEFDGATYDPAKLTPCFDWNYGDCTASFNQGRERYDPEKIGVAGGIATLLVEPQVPSVANSACLDGQCTYKAGLFSTARPNAGDGSDYLYAFTYGFVEARVKFPGTRGFFTAFWMLPADPTYSYATEIDIVEILGHDPTTIWMHYHYNDRSSYHRVNSGVGDNGACAVKDYSQDWVRFGLDWQPDHVAWYIDGVKCGQFDGAPGEIESGPMQLILHNMVDNNWQRDWGETTASQDLVRQMDVDWIRVHQLQ